MPRMRVHAKTWVVVCDGSKALVYRNTGDALAISLTIVKTLEEPHEPTRELGTDKPGRSVTSTTGSRSAMEPTDWHDLAEARFLERLAETLDASVRTGEAKTIILIAPPRALGVLREHLSPAVRNATKFEIAKDLVRMPTSAIEEFLQTEGELS